MGFTGAPSAGKDTSADHLIKEHDFVRLAFADPIRKAALTLNPWVDGDCRLSHVVNKFGWDIAKNKFPEVRRLLQILGTEVGRDLYGSHVWIDKLFQSIDSFATRQRIAITDVRFEDEAAALRERGAFIIRVNRNVDSRDEVMAHRSEIESAGISPNYVLPNHGTIGDLHRRLDRLVPRLAKHRRNP